MLRNKFYVSGNQNLQVPAHLNFGKYILDKLRCVGDAVAIVHAETDDKITYVELIDRAVKTAVALYNRGVRRGDIVAVGAEHQNVTYLPTLLGVILSGATLTAFWIDIGKEYLEHKLVISKPKYILCSDKFLEKYAVTLEKYKTGIVFVRLDKDFPLIDGVDVSMFEPLPVQGQSDTAIIGFSSGTTGMPKGVQFTHLNCILSCHCDSRGLTSNGETSTSTVCALGTFDYGCHFFMALRSLILHKKMVLFSDDTLLLAFQKEQINTAFLPTTYINMLVKSELGKNINLECLHTVYTFGNIMHVEAIQKLKEKYPTIKHVLQIYGTTETNDLTSEDYGPKGPRMGSVGCVYPGVILKVENPVTHEVLGPNQQGQIFMKGPKLMKGYIGVDPSTYLDEEGWFDTGDLGYYDEDGYFYLMGRNKDVIKYFDDVISLHELEYAVMSHPAVLEAGVVGKPDLVYGEVPAAFVVRQSGSTVTEQELIDFIAQRFPDYMQLRGGVRFLPSLPKSERGKILRRSLANMLNNATC